MLTAEFRVALPNAIHLSLDEPRDALVIHATRGAFIVNARLHLCEVIDSPGYQTCERVELSVSADEPAPPEMESESEHARKARTEYVRERHSAFAEAAWSVLNAVVQYARIELRNAEIVTPGLDSYDLLNPSWNYRGSRFSHNSFDFGTLSLILASDFLHEDALLELESYVQSPPRIELPVSLALDARRSLKEGNLRQAVVELAMAAEIATKRAFFSYTSPAGAAFDYMENKRSSSLSLAEWLKAAAEEVFGESFSANHPNDARGVDHLMRCRNQVVHRGALVFKDDKGKLTSVDAALILDWLQAVNELLIWLDEKVSTFSEQRPPGLSP